MFVVILAEKPSQAKDYAAAFQNTTKKNGYIEVNDPRYFQGRAVITWGYGHLVSLAEPHRYNKEWKKWSLEKLPILPTAFMFDIPKDKKPQFEIVKRLLVSATRIIIATDADREGENIARSIIEEAGAGAMPIERLWINSLEAEEVRSGFSRLRAGDDYLALYEEAKARQFGDWLVGMNASRVYSLLLQGRGIHQAFSVGRVQTPTLYLIYAREGEIKNFKPEPYVELFADIEAKDGKFSAKHKQRYKDMGEVKKLFHKHGIQRTERGRVLSVKQTERSVQSPLLHSLSTLQTKANKRWKYSPSKVLSAVQSLYEKKLLSYPRTDCNYITENEFRYVNTQLDGYKQALNLEPEVAGQITSTRPERRYVDGSKVKEHYAIIPTKKVPTPKRIAGLPAIERNIYDEVVRNTLAMFMPKHRYEETIVNVDVKGLGFEAKGIVERERGFKALLFTQEKKDDKRPKLPGVNEGETVTVAIKPREDVTKPPKPYTNGQLINLMKTAGQAVEDEELKAVLKETAGIGTEATRSSIIETLIRENYITINKNIVGITDKGRILCEAVEGTLLSKAEMTAEWEQFLKTIGQGEKTKEQFLANIESFILHLLETSPKHVQQMKVPAAAKAEITAKHVAKCPSRGGGLVSKGRVYGCERYKEGCKQIIPKRIAGKTLTENQVKMLCSKRETKKIKGFISKNKKKFSAVLVLNEEGKTTFKFD